MRRASDREDGAALLLALLVIVLLAALGAGLIALADTEAALSHHHRASGEVLYAAEAAAERAITEIRLTASWTSALTGASRSSVFATSATPRTPWGATLDLMLLTAELQAASNGVYGTGPNVPVWRVYAAGSLDDLAGSTLPAAAAYAVVWVADDSAETDSDRLTDGNDVLLLRAMAVNALGMRRLVQAAVQRAGNSVRVLSWRLAE
jgi:hypothetical protein